MTETHNLYCVDKCPVGKIMVDNLLRENESSLDAAFDMYYSSLKCREMCPHKEEILKFNKEEN